MVCGMCEAHLQETIRSNFPVCKVKADRHSEQIVIQSREVLDREKVQQVIEETGYIFAGYGE